MTTSPLPKLRHEEILRYEEILRVVRAAVALGVRKVRITGGDPLVRKGIDRFLLLVGAIPGLDEVTLTTNALALKEHLESIRSAGIRRLNISMDTLRRDRFHRITGVDGFDRVWGNIHRAHEMGFHPIKLNVVVLRGVNDDELVDLAALSREHPFHVRFIEYMPIGSGKPENQMVPIGEIRKRVRALGELIPVANDPCGGPAQRFRIPGAAGEIGFIAAMSHHFCERCNRLRLTASGALRPCLLSDRQVDLKIPLRRGGSEEEIRALILKAVRFKEKAHAIARGKGISVMGQMSSIGG